MSDSPKSQRKDTIKRVYGINKRKSIIGAFISRKSIAESKGAKILDGACTGCGSVLDLETIEEHVPAKAMMKKFETLMLGRQRTMFGNIMKEVGVKVAKLENASKSPSRSSNSGDNGRRNSNIPSPKYLK